MKDKIIALTELVVNEYGDFIFKNNGHLAEVEAIGQPIIFECSLMEDPYDVIRKHLDRYLSDLKLPEDMNSIGVVIGDETKIEGPVIYKHYYPLQFYKIIDD